MARDPARQERIEELFHALAELPAPEREAQLRERCGGDAQLEREVADLLRCLDNAPTGLDSPVLNASMPLGARLGAFRLIRLLGEGGMGQVFEAQQDFPARRVALKLIRSGMATDAVLRRFEFEATALAQLKHPGIAQVYEAGAFVTDGIGPLAGTRPYFAMELIEGRRLDDFASDLAPRQVLELVARVADAVHHAHQRGIIHRDLKPSNIIVEGSGPTAQPKVLDFGVARLAPEAGGPHSALTEAGQMIGTMAYMSPEQVAGRDADTRSDVYALGVILYQLLSGRLPHPTQGSSLYETAKSILERTPPPLESLRPNLRGDVATMVSTALAKHPSQRYTSAAELAADLRRFLNAQPISARPATTMYVLHTFARRNKVVVAAAAAILASLVLGLVGTAWQARRARDERDQAIAAQRAEARARRRTESIDQFVRDALKSSDPTQGGKQDATIVQAMDRAIQQLDQGRFRDDPDLDAGLRTVIASILEDNGRLQTAETLYTEALERYSAVNTGDGPDLAATLGSLGSVEHGLGKLEQADAHLTRALEMRQRLLKGDHADIARSLQNLALVRRARGRTAEAADLYQQSLDMNRRLDPSDKPEIAASLAGLAIIRQSLGDFDAAERLSTQSLEMVRRLYPGDHPFVARALNNLASVRLGAGKIADAEPLFQQTLEMRQRLFKGDHPDVARALGNLAQLRERLGRVADAEPLHRQAVEMRERLFKGDHPDVALSLHNLAVTVHKLGRTPEAEALETRSLEMDRRVFQGDHADIAQSLNQLADFHAALGRQDEARREFDESIAMLRRLTPDGSATLAQALARSAHARTTPDQAPAAVRELEEAVALAQRFFPPSHPFLKDCRQALDQRRADLKPG